MYIIAANYLAHFGNKFIINIYRQVGIGDIYNTEIICHWSVNLYGLLYYKLNAWLNQK